VAGPNKQTYATALARGEVPDTLFHGEFVGVLVSHAGGATALHCARIGAWWRAFGIDGLGVVVTNGGCLGLELRDGCCWKNVAGSFKREGISVAKSSGRLEI
jgi:hypothetical protein